jgi:hypothetical protein
MLVRALIPDPAAIRTLSLEPGKKNYERKANHRPHPETAWMVCRPADVYYIKATVHAAPMPINEAMEKRLGSFPKKQILTREQAKFIIWCLTYDRIEQRAKGSRYHTYGLLTKLAKRFGVTPECIVQIDKRRIWRGINRPKPKQLFFIEGDPK